MPNPVDCVSLWFGIPPFIPSRSDLLFSFQDWSQASLPAKFSCVPKNSCPPHIGFSEEFSSIVICSLPLWSLGGRTAPASRSLGPWTNPSSSIQARPPSKHPSLHGNLKNWSFFKVLSGPPPPLFFAGGPPLFHTPGFSMCTMTLAFSGTHLEGPPVPPPYFPARQPVFPSFLLPDIFCQQNPTKTFPHQFPFPPHSPHFPTETFNFLFSGISSFWGNLRAGLRTFVARCSRGSAFSVIVPSLHPFFHAPPFFQILFPPSQVRIPLSHCLRWGLLCNTS